MSTDPVKNNVAFFDQMGKKPITETQKFAGYLLWAGTSALIVPLVGLITVPALTKNYSADIYAAWMQSVIVVGLLSFTLNLCFTYAVVKFLAGEDNVEKRRRALGAMLWPTLAFSCLVVLISLVFASSLSRIIFASADYAHLVPLVFLWAVMESLFLLLTSYMQARRSIKGLSVTQICFALFKIAVIITMAACGAGLEWILGGIAAGELVFVIVLLASIIREAGWPLPTMHGLDSYLAFTLPLIPSALFFWAISASDRFFIVFLLGLSQAGVYSASFFLGNIISLFYGPVQVALFPVIAGLWAHGEKNRVATYLKYSNKLFLAISIPAVAGLFMLSQPLLAMLATPDYMAGSSLVLMIAVATVFLGLYQINAYIILLIGQTRWLTPLMVLAAAVTVAGNLLLIPAAGIIGAAISVMMANFVLAVTAIVWATRVVGNVIDFSFAAKSVAGTILMAVCVSLINFDGIGRLVAIVVVGVAVYSAWMLLTRAFSAKDIALVKDVAAGLKHGEMLK